MQSVNEAQFLDMTFSFLLFGTATVPMLATIIVPLTSIYASL